MFQIELGKQCIPVKSNSKSVRSCIHCANDSHPSSKCPKLYCRVCKIYGHSATLCIKKASTEFQFEDTKEVSIKSEPCEGHQRNNIKNISEFMTSKENKVE